MFSLAGAEQTSYITRASLCLTQLCSSFIFVTLFSFLFSQPYDTWLYSSPTVFPSTGKACSSLFKPRNYRLHLLKFFAFHLKRL
jgi:hypothetical protein